MAKGRKNGCPVNIRDWKVEIQDKSQVTETWLRIKGLTTLNRRQTATTEDGSAATDAWEEPFVTKRAATLSLNGTPLVDAGTGAQDPGQAMLDAYAEETGCEGDATLRFTDPNGHCLMADYVVTNITTEANETEGTRTWELAQVGEPVHVAFVHVDSVALKNGNSAADTLTMQVGDTPKLITTAFTPATASNKRYRVHVGNKTVARVTNITEEGFTLTAMSAGTTTVTVETLNGGKTATLTVNVTNS